MKQKYLETIEKLLDGYHPVTGEEFPDNHVINEPIVIRALHYAYETIKNAETADVKADRSEIKRKKKTRAWTEAEDRRLCSLYRDKISEQEIAKKMNRKEMEITYRLEFLREMKRQEKRREKLKKWLSEEEKENMQRLHDSNSKWKVEDDVLLTEMFDKKMSIKEIAQRMLRPESMIETRLIRLNLIDVHGEYLEEKRFTNRDSDLLRALYEDGIDISLIAARFEVSEEAIRSRLFYMGITRESPKLFPEKNANRIDMEEGEDK